MTKPGPLGRAEKFYIEQHCDTKDIKILAEELDRAVGIVEKHVTYFRDMRMKAGGQFARQGDMEKGGSIVITQNASEKSDDFRRNRKKQNSKAKNCITTIKKND